MIIDQLIHLLKASLPESLTPLQELVLRSSWSGIVYADMAAETNYVKEYLSRTASELWSSLSDFWGLSAYRNSAISEVRAIAAASNRHLQKLIVRCLQPKRREIALRAAPNSRLYILFRRCLLHG